MPPDQPIESSATPGIQVQDKPYVGTDLSPLQARAVQASTLLKAMAHPDRLILLCRLSEGEFCVGELEDALGIRQPSLSQQLGVLRQEGLVDARRQGKHIYYSLKSVEAAEVMAVLHKRLCSDLIPSGPG